MPPSVLGFSPAMKPALSVVHKQPLSKDMETTSKGGKKKKGAEGSRCAVFLQSWPVRGAAAISNPKIPNRSEEKKEDHKRGVPFFWCGLQRNASSEKKKEEHKRGVPFFGVSGPGDLKIWPEKRKRKE